MDKLNARHSANDNVVKHTARPHFIGSPNMWISSIRAAGKITVARPVAEHMFVECVDLDRGINII